MCLVLLLGLLPKNPVEALVRLCRIAEMAPEQGSLLLLSPCKELEGGGESAQEKTVSGLGNGVESGGRGTAGCAASARRGRRHGGRRQCHQGQYRYRVYIIYNTL